MKEQEVERVCDNIGVALHAKGTMGRKLTGRERDKQSPAVVDAAARESAGEE